MRRLFAMSALAFGLFVTAHADAQCVTVTRRVVSTPIASTVATRTVVVTPTVAAVAVFTPFAVAVPTYSAGYAPGYVPPANPAPPAQPAQRPAVDNSAVLSEMSKTLARINSRLDALERKVDGKSAIPPDAPTAEPVPGSTVRPTPPASGKLSRLSVFQAKCAACHSAASSAIKGGGLALLTPDDRLADLPAAVATKVLVRTYGNHPRPMPPRDSGIQPLTDEEYAALMN